MSEPVAISQPSTAVTTIAAAQSAVLQAKPVQAPITLTEAMDFGSDTVSKVASVTDKINSTVLSGDIDEVGKSLTALISSARQYDPKSTEKKGFLSFFKTKALSIKDKFSTVDHQVDLLVNQTDQRITLFKNRIGDLAQLYKANQEYHENLTNLISQLNTRIDWMEDHKPVVDATDSFSVQALSDWNSAIDSARKRVDDLGRAKLLAEQQAPQIQLMAVNSAALVQKFGEVKTTTIPVLKNAFALYILNEEQQKGAAFATKIDDITNETLKKNSQLLGKNTVAIHSALARSSIDMSTLEETQRNLIKSLDDVQKIHEDLAARLKAEKPKLEAMSKELATKVVNSGNVRQPPMAVTWTA